MASPKSFWTGSLQLGLLNVPVSLGKASTTTREPSLKTVCNCGGVPHAIDRSERCTAGSPEIVKAKGVEKADGTFQVLSVEEMAFIEESTKDDTLTVLDVQHTNKFPWDFSVGAYYVRPQKNDKTALRPFAILAQALEETGMGLVVKLCNSTTQKLGVIGIHQGVMMMALLPFKSDIREPGDEETAHHEVEAPADAVKMCIELLQASQNSEGFEWDAYEDEGLKLRQEAVERVLDGEQRPVPEAPKVKATPDIMEQIAASIAITKEKENA